MQQKDLQEIMKKRFQVKCAEVNLPVYTKVDNLVSSNDHQPMQKPQQQKIISKAESMDMAQNTFNGPALLGSFGDKSYLKSLDQLE